MNIVKKEYNQHYHENFAYREADDSQRNHARLDALMAYKSGGRLLEIGCGTGGFLRLAERHFAVEGVDVSDYAIQSIQPHFGERVRVANVEQDGLPEGRYDVIVVFNILEHLHQPHQVAEQIFSSLAPQGVMLGSVPNNYGLVGGLVTRVGNFVDQTHVATFPPNIWRNSFEAAGFQLQDFFGEVTLGRNRCFYLRGPRWPDLSFNLMFACHKA